METRHFSKTLTATGFCASLCALCLAVMFVADISLVYFVNTAYFFALGLRYEFASAAMALVAGIAGSRYFYHHR